MQYSTSKSRRRRAMRRRRFVAFLLFTALILCACFYFIPRALGIGGDGSGAGIAAQTAYDQIPPAPVEVPADDLYSKCAYLVRLSDGAVLYDKNSSERTYPASLTKMMTVLTFLENYEKEGESGEEVLERLKTESFTLPYEIFPILAQRHASMAGFQPNETVTYLDLLFACHLPSGADGSMGLAYSTAGSEEGFVKLMNEKAAELGMKNSHFANVTGLHDSEHYTTAEDLSILLRHALKNEAFRTVFTTKRHDISPTNLHPEGFTVYSTVAAKMKDMTVNRTTVLGGKTGYTEEAGLCLATLAKKGSQEYILITTNAPGNTHTEQFNITDARTIYGEL